MTEHFPIRQAIPCSEANAKVGQQHQRRSA